MHKKGKEGFLNDIEKIIAWNFTLEDRLVPQRPMSMILTHINSFILKRTSCIRFAETWSGTESIKSKELW